MYCTRGSCMYNFTYVPAHAEDLLALEHTAVNHNNIPPSGVSTADSPSRIEAWEKGLFTYSDPEFTQFLLRGIRESKVFTSVFRVNILQNATSSQPMIIPRWSATIIIASEVCLGRMICKLQPFPSVDQPMASQSYTET